ncbi:MAG TPA: cyclase family protein [Acidimicrobiia bacterium]|nr:cyclase family protein [Acidimicrobiia bacterium]
MPLSADLEHLAERVSNWGRWGRDDQRGTLNLITPAVVQRGIAAARHGRVFSLAIPFDQTGPQWDNVHMPERINPELHTHTVNVAFTGDDRDFTTNDDSFRMGSQAVTHWDSLAHVGYGGKLYNDTPNDVVRADGGAAELGIEHFGPVVTRGVLLDIARVHGVDHFDDNHPVTADDLDAAVQAAGVTVQPGDAILVRTGQMHFLRRGDKQRYSMPSPGLSTQSVGWLRDHDVAAVATDTMTFECYPCEDPAVFMPVHMIQLRDMGLAQGQNWHLDDLAADCAADGSYECLLVAPPLPLTGAVGAPVVPVAVK